MKKIELKTGTLSIQESGELSNLVDYGSRINKKRGFLFVSKVLGKHLPVSPIVMEETYQKLSKLIPQNDELTLFVGFAETATALGHGVFDCYRSKNSLYIHSTRYQTSDPIFFSFYEEHCHAPSHIFYEPRDPKLKEQMKKVTRVVLIDDEVSTGNTANNLVEQMKKVLPAVKKYYLLTILNWAEKEYDNFEYLSLYRGSFSFSPDKDALSRIETVVSEPEVVVNLDDIIPNGYARYGTSLTKQLPNISTLLPQIRGRTLVLGTSEFMYHPYLLARYLESEGIDVMYQATTRSPVNVDGAITSKIVFKDNYFENIDNFLYNVIDRDYDTVIICYETTALPLDFDLKEQLKNKFKVIEYFFNKEGYTK